jgi:hypothetical protein
MNMEEILWEGVEWFVRSKTVIISSFCEHCSKSWISIKCGNFLTGTKDPSSSQKGLCSVELDMKVQDTGNIVAKVGTILISDYST